MPGQDSPGRQPSHLADASPNQTIAIAKECGELKAVLFDVAHGSCLGNKMSPSNSNNQHLACQKPDKYTLYTNTERAEGGRLAALGEHKPISTTLGLL